MLARWLVDSTEMLQQRIPSDSALSDLEDSGHSCVDNF